MRLLFESISYDPSFEKTLDLPSGSWSRPRTGVGIQMDCVGYFYSRTTQDYVFVLPKVYLSSDKATDTSANVAADNGAATKTAFGKYDVKKLAEGDLSEIKSDSTLMAHIQEARDWCYLSVRRFHDEHPDSQIIITDGESLKVRSKGKTMRNLIDIALSLIEFHKEQHSLITYITKLSHQGVNKINWSKTINKTSPFIVDGQPFYISFFNKHKTINYDEELIVLFYSVLNYLKNKFPHNVAPPFGFSLIPPRKIGAMIDGGKGARYLKSIRKKYFKDELVRLWDLLYAFFNAAEGIKANKTRNEILLARDFNIVFEAMIDSILSDKDLPSGLKEQKDGKIVDHLYLGDSWFEKDADGKAIDGKVWYVGDSKYYSDDNDIEGTSLYKQFTYARNIIQMCIDWKLKEDQKKGHLAEADGEQATTSKDNWQNDYSKLGLRYRDDLTEGYSPTPNFFIRGDYIKPGTEAGNADFMWLYGERPEKDTEAVGNQPNDGNGDGRGRKKDNIFTSCHFPDRLFDRDTLMLMTFSIDFMHVLKMYAGKVDTGDARARMRNIIQKTFREKILERHAFYKVTPTTGTPPDDRETPETLKSFVSANFRRFTGKMYHTKDADFIWFAFERDNQYAKDSAKLHEDLGGRAEVKPL